MTEDRLARIENKLDQLTDAMGNSLATSGDWSLGPAAGGDQHMPGQGHQHARGPHHGQVLTAGQGGHASAGGTSRFLGVTRIIRPSMPFCVRNARRAADSVVSEIAAPLPALLP